MLLHAWAKPASDQNGNAELIVKSVDDSIQIADAGYLAFGMSLNHNEARDLRDKLSAVLDAQVVQQVAA
jgi:hypothetical protein